MSAFYSTRAVEKLFDRVQLPPSAVTVVCTSHRGHRELLVWVDEGFRSVLKDFPRRVDGATVRAEVRPMIMARSPSAG
jgi:hypothetical protein